MLICARDQRGQVIALVGLLLGVVLLGMGLGVDGGQLFAARRAGQAAADAGAWAGAVRLYNGGTLAQAQTDACTDIARNGFTTTGCPTGSFIVRTPTSGAFSGNTSYVEVIITQSVATTFFRATGVRALTTVTTRAVAGVRGCGGTTHAVLVQDVNPASALDINNASTKLAVTGGGIRVNSTNGSAASINGSGVDLTAVGYYIRLGQATSGDAGEMSPAPTFSVTPADADPIACVAEPDTTPMTDFTAKNISTNTILDPGDYAGGIQVTAGTVTLKPGVYVLRGGPTAGTNYGLTVSGTGSIVAQSGGVLIFVTNQNYPAAGGRCPSVSMTGTGTVDLRAQSTGTYAGILLWGDLACPGTNGTITPGAAWTRFTGTVYYPGTAGTSRIFIVDLAANAAIGSQLVVHRLRVQKNFTLTLDYDPTLNYRKFPALVE